jgi:TetR/AcrR family transcriptional regulator
VSRKPIKEFRPAVCEEESGRMSSQDRRRQLLDVAIRLFSESGFSGTTTKEIALAAGVTEALIFRHFASKDELYAAILDFKASETGVEETLDDLRRYAERRDDEGLFGSLASKIVEHYRKDLNFMRLMFYSALERHELAHQFCEKQFTPIHDFLSGYIALRQREGAFRRCNPAAAVRAFMAMHVYNALVNRLLEFKALDVSDEEAIETFTMIFLDGLRSGAPRRGRARAHAAEAPKRVEKQG